MSRALGFVLLGVGGWLVLGTLGGCNSLLDIQEAQLSTSPGYTGGTSGLELGPNPGPDTCQSKVSKACADCVTKNCTVRQRNVCLGDKACRKSIAIYSNCLGPLCQDIEGRCFEEELLNPTERFDLDCVSACGIECAITPIISTCELYCGCMVHNCSTKVQEADKDRYSTVAGCMAFCSTLSPETVACRWSHCERAPDDLTLPHCDHADGIVICSATDQPARPSQCHNLSNIGFYCEKDADCCSKNCNPGSKACVGA